uniref:Uncharacterized protein n=1 Tax=Lactuca sativa TaxID=4236 RepID=A0A9R1V9K0_LACSA|nr:hypothetical protein LSAT_V11C600339530 [Lactuca sativa]
MDPTPQFLHQTHLHRFTKRLSIALILLFSYSWQFEVYKGEFLCPVCRGLANSVLPDFPREGMIMKESVASPKIPNLSPMDAANYESFLKFGKI